MSIATVVARMSVCAGVIWTGCGQATKSSSVSPPVHPPAELSLSEQHEYALKEACPLLDVLAPDWTHDAAEVQHTLQKLQPTLDIDRYRTLLTEIFSVDPTADTCSVPPTMKTTPVQDQELSPKFDALAIQVQALKAAGALYYSSNPRDHWRVVVATSKPYVDTFEVEISHRERYTSISMQDLLYQVPEAIRDFPAISFFPNLVSLILFGNDLTDLHFECDTLPALRAIDLSENQFTAIPTELIECKALEYINLSENPIASFPATIGDLKHLKYLGLNGHSLTDDQVADLKATLPNCTVETDRRVYTAQEKMFNLILGTELGVLGDSSLVDGGGLLPRDSGIHYVPGTAQIAPDTGVAIVLAIDSATGDTRVFRRDEGGGYQEVTDRAVDLSSVYSLAPE